MGKHPILKRKLLLKSFLARINVDFARNLVLARLILDWHLNTPTVGVTALSIRKAHLPPRWKSDGTDWK